MILNNIQNSYIKPTYMSWYKLYFLYSTISQLYDGHSALDPSVAHTMLVLCYRGHAVMSKVSQATSLKN